MQEVHGLCVNSKQGEEFSVDFINFFAHFLYLRFYQFYLFTRSAQHNIKFIHILTIMFHDLFAKIRIPLATIAAERALTKEKSLCAASLRG